MPYDLFLKGTERSDLWRVLVLHKVCRQAGRRGCTKQAKQQRVGLCGSMLNSNCPALGAPHHRAPRMQMPRTPGTALRDTSILYALGSHALLLSRLGRGCLQFGGVYADMDVECLQPVDEWNAAHGHDAAVLLGTENVDVKRKPHRVHVTNWAMAAMPGHPLLAAFSAVVVREIQKQFFKFADDERELTPKAYEAGILDRTGPAALTAAMYDFFDGIGFDLNKVTERDLKGKHGVVAGGVRVLPVVALSSGWEVAVARSKGARYTCEQLGKATPQALVCHMFWGSWRSTWRTFKQKFTYDNC